MRFPVLTVLALLLGCAPPDPVAHVAELIPDTGMVADLRVAAPAYGLALVVTPDRVRVAPVGSFDGFDEPSRVVLEAVLDLPVTDGVFDEDELKGILAVPLYDALQERAEAWKDQGELMIIEDHDFRGELWLLVERRVDFEALRSVMYSAGQAQYSDFRLVSFGQAAPIAAAQSDREDSGIGRQMGWQAFPTWRPDPRVGLRQGDLMAALTLGPEEEPPEHRPRFEVDDRGASFTISAPKEDRLSPALCVDPVAMNGILRADASNPRLYPSFAAAIEAAAHPVLPSLELLLHSSKLADDRMMAALERHEAPDRAAWIEAMVRAQLAAPGGDGGPEALSWLAAAALLGGQEPGAWGVQESELIRAGDLVWDFEAQARRSKPLGIYSEAEDLQAIFARDRFLLTPLRSRFEPERRVVLGLRALLQQQPALAEALRWDHALQAMLTNPSVVPGVLDADPGDLPDTLALLPPSTSREVELVEELGGTAMVGPNTMQVFVDAIRDGRVSLQPREDSGWYDHQQWALEPLLSLPEAAVLQADEGYVQRLERAFEAAIAMRRETHIKALQLPAIGAAWSERVSVTVAPDLRVEPLPTHYERSAVAYDFLMGAVLEPHFDTAWEGWDDGAVMADLLGAQRVYRDAAAIARADLGLDAGEGESVDATAAWLGAWWEDPRMAEDLRFMIPFGEDAAGHPIAWTVLGVKTVDITVAYDEPPAVRSLDPAYELDVTFAEARYTLPVLVFAELPVAEILDRQELRALGDQHPGQRDLMGALAPVREVRGGGCSR
jgi:hypothetical protein